MDLNQIKDAAQIVFEICRNHPEICPHRYEWQSTKITESCGYKVEEKLYRCTICGDEKETNECIQKLES